MWHAVVITHDFFMTIVGLRDFITAQYTNDSNEVLK